MKKQSKITSCLLAAALLSCSAIGYPAFASSGSLYASHAKYGQTQASVRKTANYEPLQGLVADDILAKFRAALPYGSSYKNEYIFGDLISEEAFDLGGWVQGYSLYFNDNIRYMGNALGNKYEWYLGTDTSNNFYENFRYIYAAYYGLKNYYNNGGSIGCYNALASDYAYFYSRSSADAALRQMYADFQNFITECNNVVRMH